MCARDSRGPGRRRAGRRSSLGANHHRHHRRFGQGRSGPGSAGRDRHPHQRSARHAHGAGLTNATGDFVVPNVTPDTYTVEISMPGFSSTVRPGVAISGGDRVSVGALILSVGGTTETVTVKSEAPLIQSQSGERSFRITTAEVENLPIGTGRNFATFTSLTPGVVGTTTRLGGGGQNNIMMDGVSTMDTGNNG